MGEGSMKAKQSYEVIDPRQRRGRRAGEEGGPGTVAIGYMYRAARARGGDGWFRRLLGASSEVVLRLAHVTVTSVSFKPPWPSQLTAEL